MGSQPLTQTRARHQVSLPYSSTALHRPSSPSRPGSSILIVDCRSEGSLTAENHARCWTGKKSTNRCRGHVMSVDMLPDDVLLEIFEFFAEKLGPTKEAIEEWQTLVHVCRRWRSVVFGSPHRLNLRLFCSNKTPARDTLHVWPALPLFIECHGTAASVDNIVAVLERSDRVCNIGLINSKSLDLEKCLAEMQVPFPELTDLRLWSNGETMSVFPDSCLGGSAPGLEDLSLNGIPFPGLPNLLLSATHLVTLELNNIPHSGYFPPEAIVTALSTSTRLTTLSLHFESPQSQPDRTRQYPPPLTRSVLLALTDFRFKGVNEYLEVVVARIDAPRLNKLNITFFNDIVFDTPQFTRFVSRTPMLKRLETAWVTFQDDAAAVKLLSETSGKGEKLKVTIPCRELDWQVSSMEQVCTSCLPPLLTLENLYIYENPHRRIHWQGDIENAVWLELLHPFTSVKNLYLSESIARRIVPALQEHVGGATEVLPTCRIFSWRSASHLGLSRRSFSSSLPCDRPPVIL